MAPQDASPSATASDGPKLTENDARVLSLAWQCFKTMPAVDTAKLASLGGWKTAASANTAFCNAKKKLLGDLKLPPAGAEKAAPGKKGKAAGSASAGDVGGGGGGGEDDDGEEVAGAGEQSPVKKKAAMRATPARKRKAAAAAVEGEGEDEASGETPKKKKAKTPRKKKLAVKDVTSSSEGDGDEGETVAGAVKSEEAAVKNEDVDDAGAGGAEAGDVEMKESIAEGDTRPSVEGLELTAGVV